MFPILNKLCLSVGIDSLLLYIILSLSELVVFVNWSDLLGSMLRVA